MVFSKILKTEYNDTVLFKRLNEKKVAMMKWCVN